MSRCAKGCLYPCGVYACLEDHPDNYSEAPMETCEICNKPIKPRDRVIWRRKYSAETVYVHMACRPGA